MTPWIPLGAAFAFLGVGLGAFGVHGLRSVLDAEALQTFETGARYQMYHALGLVLLAALSPRLAEGPATWTGWLFTAGILLFSGSLYLLAVTGTRWLGAITPLGGLCLLAGWALLVYAGVRG
jgi:uncharacterized membrane protein YgdD (TMEM256/DUF423 family)